MHKYSIRLNTTGINYASYGASSCKEDYLALDTVAFQDNGTAISDMRGGGDNLDFSANGTAIYQLYRMYWWNPVSLLSSTFRYNGTAIYSLSDASVLDSVFRHNSSAIVYMANTQLERTLIADNGGSAIAQLHSGTLDRNTIVRNGGVVGTTTLGSVMDDSPLTCTPETQIDEVRRMMPRRRGQRLHTR